MFKTFKDFVQSDISAAFTVQDEFAEKAVIEGVEMDVVMDTAINLPSNMKNQVAKYDIVFHVAASYFTEVPQTEKMLNFNGKDYFITHVDNVMGMLTIALSRNQS